MSMNREKLKEIVAEADSIEKWEKLALVAFGALVGETGNVTVNIYVNPAREEKEKGK